MRGERRGGERRGRGEGVLGGPDLGRWGGPRALERGTRAGDLRASVTGAANYSITRGRRRGNRSDLG